jgi:hypothetical protein
VSLKLQLRRLLLANKVLAEKLAALERRVSYPGNCQQLFCPSQSLQSDQFELQTSCAVPTTRPSTTVLPLGR